MLYFFQHHHFQMLLMYSLHQKQKFLHLHQQFLLLLPHHQYWHIQFHQNQLMQFLQSQL